jgi:hypothetical protein
LNIYFQDRDPQGIEKNISSLPNCSRARHSITRVIVGGIVGGLIPSIVNLYTRESANFDGLKILVPYIALGSGVGGMTSYMASSFQSYWNSLQSLDPVILVEYWMDSKADREETEIFKTETIEGSLPNEKNDSAFIKRTALSTKPERMQHEALFYTTLHKPIPHIAGVYEILKN